MVNSLSLSEGALLTEEADWEHIVLIFEIQPVEADWEHNQLIASQMIMMVVMAVGVMMMMVKIISMIMIMIL